MAVGELEVKVRVTEGDALFESLVELAQLTRQHAELSERISALSLEIRQLVDVDVSSHGPN